MRVLGTSEKMMSENRPEQTAARRASKDRKGEEFLDGFVSGAVLVGFAVGLAGSILLLLQLRSQAAAESVIVGWAIIASYPAIGAFPRRGTQGFRFFRMSAHLSLWGGVLLSLETAMLSAFPGTEAFLAGVFFGAAAVAFEVALHLLVRKSLARIPWANPPAR